MFYETVRHTTDVASIAKICHEANRAYCQTIGDYSQPPWESAPNWQVSSAISGVEFHMDQLSRGGEPPASASHDSWLKQKRDEGWKYGPIKDPSKKEHPCVVPFDQLTLEQRVKDYIFGAIVKAIWLSENGD